MVIVLYSYPKHDDSLTRDGAGKCKAFHHSLRAARDRILKAPPTYRPAKQDLNPRNQEQGPKREEQEPAQSSRIYLGEWPQKLSCIDHVQEWKLLASFPWRSTP